MTNLFEGQTRTAAVAKQLRGELAACPQLRPFFDFRPTQSRLTLVSFFDYYPMRGVELPPTLEAGREALRELVANRALLLSERDDKDKIEFLEQRLNFTVPVHSDGDDGSDSHDPSYHLESHVQAAISRDLLALDPKVAHWRRHLAENVLRLAEIDYLTTELAWSAGGSRQRPDIVCLSGQDVVIIETKKKRQTSLEQVVEYKASIEANMPSFRSFVLALSGAVLPERPRIHLVFVMPYTTGQAPDWQGIANRFGVSIAFYQRSFPPASFFRANN